MKNTWIAAVACVLMLASATAEEAPVTGQASNGDSYAPAPGQSVQAYVDIDTTSTKGLPGLVSQVSFANEQFDVVYMRSRLLNGSIQNIRIFRGQKFIVGTGGEPAICMCWHNAKPVYQCLHPDPVAIPVNTLFLFGQAGNFQKCSASF